MDTVFVILQSSQRSQILHKKISTRLLTLLIMGVILHLEQRKGNKKERTVPAGGSKRKLIQMASMSRRNGGMTYVTA